MPRPQKNLTSHIEVGSFFFVSAAPMIVIKSETKVQGPVIPQSRMQSLRLTFFLSLALASTNITAQQIDYKGLPEWSWGKKDSTEFYVYTPSTVRPGEKYPLVLFLHGCCGTDYHATLRNTVDPPVRVWHNFGMNNQREPTYIISAKTKTGWRQHFNNLKAVLDSLVKNHSVDPQRLYISGFSMGAQGTWEFIEKYPDYFAAAIPIGMDFKGQDPAKFKDVPIWTIRGEKDWWARNLGKQMSVIRKLNGGAPDSADWVTGVNPRMTTFTGMEHGVMWLAVSKLDLLEWTYSKLNDGNKYPIIYFTSPVYKTRFNEGEAVTLNIAAIDPDGRIEKIEVFNHKKSVKTINALPYSVTMQASKGDSKITAVAFDDKGKTATATMLFQVDAPVKIETQSLSIAYQGDYYNQQLSATGNGEIVFSVSNKTSIPEGLRLSETGFIRGIPVTIGKFTFKIIAKDEDGDVTESNFILQVLKKKQDEVIVKNAKNYAGKRFSVSKVRLGEMPHLRGDDEVTFSSIGKYAGLTFIQPDANDTADAKPHYMTFEVDEEVTVYIAYERLNNLYTSTIPAWLKEYRKEDSEQVIAQYFYYDVYSKDFPKGLIKLPDAEEKSNGVNTNYFVMLKKKER